MIARATDLSVSQRSALGIGGRGADSEILARNGRRSSTKGDYWSRSDDYKVACVRVVGRVVCSAIGWGQICGNYIGPSIDPGICVWVVSNVTYISRN